MSHTKGIAHYGGERGIRTLDRAIEPYIRFPGERLQPLSHFSVPNYCITNYKKVQINLFNAFLISF